MTKQQKTRRVSPQPWPFSKSKIALQTKIPTIDFTSIISIIKSNHEE
jgi:hypothetical protein